MSTPTTERRGARGDRERARAGADVERHLLAVGGEQTAQARRVASARSSWWSASRAAGSCEASVERV